RPRRAGRGGGDGGHRRGAGGGVRPTVSESRDGARGGEIRAREPDPPGPAASHRRRRDRGAAPDRGRERGAREGGGDGAGGGSWPSRRLKVGAIGGQAVVAESFLAEIVHRPGGVPVRGQRHGKSLVRIHRARPDQLGALLVV